MKNSPHALVSFGILFISGLEMSWAGTTKPGSEKPAEGKTDYDYNSMEPQVQNDWPVGEGPPQGPPQPLPQPGPAQLGPQLGPQPGPLHLLEPGMDYCSTRCSTNHIACQQNIVEPSTECRYSNGEYNDMSDLKDFIVAFHNHLRNTVASGLMPNLKPAARMGTIRWSPVLHAMAALKTNLCLVLSNVCHGTRQFKYSGQNTAIYTYAGTVNTVPISMVVKDVLDHWYNGSSRCNRDVIKNFSPPQEDTQHLPDYGVFTMMVREDNTHVGCALNRYEPVHNIIKVMFTCAYATNNFLNSPTYKEGPPASECKTGKNTRYPNLCSKQETYFHGN